MSESGDSSPRKGGGTRRRHATGRAQWACDSDASRVIDRIIRDARDTGDCRELSALVGCRPGFAEEVGMKAWSEVAVVLFEHAAKAEMRGFSPREFEDLEGVRREESARSKAALLEKVRLEMEAARAAVMKILKRNRAA